LIGQGCLEAGQTKATFGTGAFILTQTGRSLPESRHRLLATVAWQIGGERNYALEGSIFVAGSLIKWLRDDLGIIANAEETEILARSVADNGGVYLVPALSGLGAPHWLPDARAAISGLSFASRKAHVARAALEAMAHQTGDLKTAFAADGADWAELRVDGGMIVNNWLVQDLADMLEIAVERPHFVETTAMGAAMLAGVGAGLYPSLAASAGMRGDIARFTPEMEGSVRQRRRTGWASALNAVVDAV
jgi:glycerol kinase